MSRQKNLKNVFDEAIRAVLTPQDLRPEQVKPKPKMCVIL